jgi:hypothetical protein
MGALLSQPMVEVQGSYRPAEPGALRQAVVEPAPGLRLYQEQVWLRMLNAMQAAFPRLTLVMGPAAFNQLALDWLVAHPPGHWDLGRCADGFAARGLDTWSASSLPAQALRLDEAFRRALASPWVRPWRPTSAELARLPSSRLAVAPSLAMGRMNWMLVDLDGPFAPLDRPSSWLCARTPSGAQLRPVDHGLARLIALSARVPLSEAVARLEQEGDPERLARAIPAWIELALSEGWWTGLVDPAA